jgi:hypothetical protein
MFILACLLALPSTASLAQPFQRPQSQPELQRQPQPQLEPRTIVETLVIPCTGQTPPDQCGTKVHVVQGSATFTAIDGTVYTVFAGHTFLINGNGAASDTASNENILNFASAVGAAGNGTALAETGPQESNASSSGNSELGGGNSGKPVTSGSSGVTGSGSSGTGSSGTATGAAAPMSKASSQ